MLGENDCRCVGPGWNVSGVAPGGSRFYDAAASGAMVRRMVAMPAMAMFLGFIRPSRLKSLEVWRRWSLLNSRGAPWVCLGPQSLKQFPGVNHGRPGVAGNNRANEGGEPPLHQTNEFEGPAVPFGQAIFSEREACQCGTERGSSRWMNCRGRRRIWNRPTSLILGITLGMKANSTLRRGLCK